MTELSIQDIANWFLAKEAMTHKKLQKLCYYAVAWGYALTDDYIATNDKFQAWVHGPVSRTLYNTYKENGWNLLDQFTSDIEMPDNIQELLQSVWVTYGDKDGNELEALSHIEQPWKNARVGVKEDERSENTIDIDDMKKFYRSIYKGDDK